MVVDVLTLVELLGLRLVDKKVTNTLQRLQGPCVEDDFLGAIYKSFKAEGVSFLAKETPKRRGALKRGGRPVSSIFFYTDGRDGYSGFRGELPYSIHFGDSSESVLAKLGQPKKRGRTCYPEDSPIKPGIVEFSLLYETESFKLHYTFDNQDRLVQFICFCSQDVEWL
jgi:hypothetical protein